MPEDEGDEFFDSAPPSAHPAGNPVTQRGGGSSASLDDDSEDSGAPLTPGPGRTFTLPPKQTMPGALSRSSSASTPASPDEEDEPAIEDDWVDPSIPTPSELSPVSSPPPPPAAQLGEGKEKREKKEKRRHVQEASYPFPVAPVDEVPGAFPVEEHGRKERERVESRVKRVPQMRTAKARDGGRTKSGGVRGIPTDDA